MVPDGNTVLHLTSLSIQPKREMCHAAFINVFDGMATRYALLSPLRSPKSLRLKKPVYESTREPLQSSGKREAVEPCFSHPVASLQTAAQKKPDEEWESKEQ